MTQLFTSSQRFPLDRTGMDRRVHTSWSWNCIWAREPSSVVIPNYSYSSSQSELRNSECLQKLQTFLDPHRSWREDVSSASAGDLTSAADRSGHLGGGWMTIGLPETPADPGSSPKTRPDGVLKNVWQQSRCRKSGTEEHQGVFQILIPASSPAPAKSANGPKSKRGHGWCWLSLAASFKMSFQHIICFITNIFMFTRKE